MTTGLVERLARRLPAARTWPPELDAVLTRVERYFETLIALTLSVVVASVVVHGISVTPMMAAYERALQRAPTERARRR